MIRAPRQVVLRLDNGGLIRATEGGGAAVLSPSAAFAAGLLKQEHLARLEGLISHLRAKLPLEAQPLPGAPGSGHKRKSYELAEVQASREQVPRPLSLAAGAM